MFKTSVNYFNKTIFVRKMDDTDLDELSSSWQLESAYPLFRGIASLVVAIVSLVLLCSLIVKIRKKLKNAKIEPRNKPDVCKYYTICCRSHFQCIDLFVIPAPLDVCICLYLLTFLTYACNAYGIIKYGNWIKAQQDPIGYIALIIFAVLVGLISLCVYLYFYSMVILTVASTGEISRWIRRMHQTLMLISAICLPSGNIMMEVYGTDFGKIFRIGQQLAYISFVCILIGICHLTLLLGNKLTLVLVDVTTNEVIPRAHSQTHLQISRTIDTISASNMQRDAQLIQVITKLIVIALTILIISAGTGAMTAIRWYFGYNIVAARYLSLARWFWFTQINIAFGCFVVYLTIGFNIGLYKYWCRCDDAVHKCVMCCVKRDTIRKVKRSVGFQSDASPTSLDNLQQVVSFSINSNPSDNNRNGTSKGVKADKAQTKDLEAEIDNPDPKLETKLYRVN
eukprot:807760_1